MDTRRTNNEQWITITRTALLSRALDKVEEQELYPQKKIYYQFSARGHEVSQAILGSLLTHPHDGVGAYYRNRPLLLALGLTPEEALTSSLGRAGGYSSGRDVGVTCNLPSRGGATVFPMAGDVGSQYTPVIGWAQAVVHRRTVMGESEYNGAIGCVLGGEGSTATGGFWSALNIATTLKLPVLFVIEDNGYAISVPGALQSPGGDVAANLKSFSSLMVLSGNGTDAEETASLLHTAVQAVRQGAGPALVHLKVPRLSGHSGQDTQAYKSEEVVKEEQSRDPLPKLRLALCSRGILSEEEWRALEAEAREAVQGAKERALRLREAEADRKEIARHVFCETQNDGTPDLSVVGGARGEGFPLQTSEFAPEPTRTNMLTAIRRTLQGELRENPRVVVFGEDVGPKGGVHGATLGLQTEFGEARVFDTSLSEEGIIGRAVGMALNGLVPIPEIQFRKYADAATEQLNNCGTIRWRTTNRFAAPMVVRIPIGFLRCGDPWHSVSNEVFWAHAVGWQVALPSNAEDAVGLLRTAIRGHNPVVFLEHRALYDSPWARRPYPGDRFTLPFGEARVTRTGERLTVVTWGAYVERCETAAERVGGSAIEIIDLRTIVPWDRAAVLHSVRKTRRCLVVHEDGITAGFGAEVAAVVAEEAFFSLDAPVSRIGVCDIPIPYNVHLMEATLPSVEEIEAKMTELLEA